MFFIEGIFILKKRSDIPNKRKTSYDKIYSTKKLHNKLEDLTETILGVADSFGAEFFPL